MLGALNRSFISRNRAVLSDASIDRFVNHSPPSKRTLAPAEIIVAMAATQAASALDWAVKDCQKPSVIREFLLRRKGPGWAI
jgi:hypothetical protein